MIHQSVERLNITQPKANWEFLNFESKVNDILLSNCLALPSSFSNSKIELVLLGGRMNMDSADQNNTYTLDIEIHKNKLFNKATLNPCNWIMVDESFNNRLGAPTLFTENKGVKCFIGESGAPYIISS